MKVISIIINLEHKNHLKKIDYTSLAKFTIYELCLKEFKTEEERLYIAEHLYLRVPFFVKVKKELIAIIARKISSWEFKTGENIYIHHGQEINGDENINNDKIFIIFKGSALIFGQKDKGKIISENWVWGRVTSEISPSKIIAQTDCQMLVIMREDYDLIISDSIEMQNFKNKKYLRELKILRDWPLSKREEFWDAFVWIYSSYVIV